MAEELGMRPLVARCHLDAGCLRLAAGYRAPRPRASAAGGGDVPRARYGLLGGQGGVRTPEPGGDDGGALGAVRGFLSDV
jgi:hypothetical protein